MSMSDAKSTPAKSIKRTLPSGLDIAWRPNSVPITAQVGWYDRVDFIAPKIGVDEVKDVGG